MSSEANAEVVDYSAGRSENGPPAWWSYLGPVGVLKILVLVGLMGWLYQEHLGRLFKYWKDPDWSHGFLLPLFVLYLVNMRRGQLLTGEHRGSWWGLVLMIGCFAGFAWCVRAKYGYPQHLSILGMITGLILLLRGWRTLWLTVFPLSFLFLAIPPPRRLYDELTHPLQQAAAAVSGFVLNVFPGVMEIERAGIKLAYFMEGGREGSFTVAGACSGMRSLMAFVALGLAMAYLSDRPTWHRVALAVLVIPVALFCNIARVVVTGSLQMYGKEELATGSPHMVLGLMMFAIGFIMYMSILWLLDNLFTDDPDLETGMGGA